MSKLKKILAAEGLVKTALDMDALSNAVDALSDGLADVMDHSALQWGNTPGLAKAQSNITHALMGYQDELEKFYSQEKARLEEERKREMYRHLEKEVPAKMKRFLGVGGKWEGLFKDGSNGWEAYPPPGISHREGQKIVTALAKEVSKILAGGTLQSQFRHYEVLWPNGINALVTGDFNDGASPGDSDYLEGISVHIFSRTA
jgi:hypothetical protein